ncbi:type III-B CRISPR module-associated protein Cmr5 [Syntrophorhabdus aromaticivorans]|uniref:type III-B CRISPR module-associated protein Cmr5 n=1 Tax=Syntrophorhabdus aromaticivorans TaxID=328301 RepID=UPI000424E209|nr:type III-B CRISPR module-associated protein Cmr5 [Syntrophorhabdus aromaticivorans]
MQTLSQRRARAALDLLSKIEERGEKRSKFSQFCKSFPTMVLKNGLGQSLAFIRSKPEKQYEIMYDTLNAWLVKELKLDGKDTFLKIHEMDAKQYMQAQTESLRFLEWVKRYESAKIF